MCNLYQQFVTTFLFKENGITTILNEIKCKYFSTMIFKQNKKYLIDVSLPLNDLEFGIFL